MVRRIRQLNDISWVRFGEGIRCVGFSKYLRYWCWQRPHQIGGDIHSIGFIGDGGSSSIRLMVILWLSCGGIDSCRGLKKLEVLPEVACAGMVLISWGCISVGSDCVGFRWHQGRLRK